MMEGKDRSSQRIIVGAVGASVLTAVVVTTVVISIYYGGYMCKDRNSTKNEVKAIQRDESVKEKKVAHFYFCCLISVIK